MLILLSIGCGRRAELDRLERELGELDRRVGSLEEREPDPVVVALPTPRPPEPPPPDPPVGSSDLSERVRAARAQARRTRALLEGVDEDLTDLENHVDRHMDSIEDLRSDLDGLARLVDRQMSVIEAVHAEVEDLTFVVSVLESRTSYLSVEDGKLVVTDADLVLRQGRDSEGLLKGNGNIYTMVGSER